MPLNIDDLLGPGSGATAQRTKPAACHEEKYAPSECSLFASVISGYVSCSLVVVFVVV